MKTCARSALCLLVGGLTAAAVAGDPAGEIFDRLDKNGDGRLTADEIPDLQKAFFESALRQGDINKDGVLTRQEFLDSLADEADGARTSGSPADPGRARALFGEYFDRLDKNGDGRLDASEIPESLKEQLQPLFERRGSVSRDDFRAIMAERAGGGAPGGSRRGLDIEQLRRWDRNGDGRLEREEIPESLRRLFAPIFERSGSESLDLEGLAQFRRREDGDRDRRRADEAGRPPSGPRDGERFRRDDEARPNRDGQPPGGEGRPPFPGGGPRGGMPSPAFFRLLDQDGNGRLSKAEMLNVVKLFDELDADGDGELDLRELMGDFGRGPGSGGFGGFGGGFGMRRPEGDPPPRDGDPPEGRGPGGFGGFGGGMGFGDPGENFARMAADKDGALSREELPEFLRSRFDDFDADSDGKITEQEYRDAIERMRRQFGGGRNRPDGENRPDRPERPQRPE